MKIKSVVINRDTSYGNEKTLFILSLIYFIINLSLHIKANRYFVQNQLYQFNN
jgi:hypothetical protein